MNPIYTPDAVLGNSCIMKHQSRTANSALGLPMKPHHAIYHLHRGSSALKPAMMIYVAA
jgi:hypothetical protein